MKAQRFVTLGLAALIGGGLFLTMNSPATSATPAAETITIEHARGKTDVPRSPQKVMVIDAPTLDTMNALDIPIAGVPQKQVRLPKFLAKYMSKDYINTGTFFEPDFEALSAAKPDLIINGGRSEAAYDELNRIAPTIDMTIDLTNFDKSFHQRTMQLATIFGKTTEAKAALDNLDQQAASVSKKAKTAGTGLVVMVNGGKLSAFGPGSRFGFIYDKLGFKPALELENKGRHGNPLSFELLLKSNPDWLFVLSRDEAKGTENAASAQQVLDNELVNQTNAKKNGRIIYFDSLTLYQGGGLQTYRYITETIDKAL